MFIEINGCVCLHQYTGSNNVTGGLYAQMCNCLPAGGVVLLLMQTGRQQHQQISEKWVFDPSQKV